MARTTSGLAAARCVLGHDDAPGVLFIADVFVPTGEDARERAWITAELIVAIAVAKLRRRLEGDW